VRRDGYVHIRIVQQGEEVGFTCFGDVARIRMAADALDGVAQALA
jgi:hypothetical protein